MTDEKAEVDVMFYQLVLSMQASTMQHLGKVVSPLSGEIERNLDAARYSIDILDMLKRKTAGNLADDEAKMFDHVLYQLRMNYVEEVKKGEEAPASETPDQPAGPESGEVTEPSESGGQSEPPSEET